MKANSFLLPVRNCRSLIHKRFTPRLPLVALLFGLATATAYADITEGLVAYYPFEGDATDASGRGHHGTVHGGLSYQAGVLGQAAYFNGVNSYIDIANHLDFRLLASDDRSFVFWVRRADLNVVSQSLLNKASDANNGLGLQFQYVNIAGANGYQQLYLHLQGGIHTKWDSFVAPTNWCCLAIVKQGQTWRVYQNGLEHTPAFTFSPAAEVNVPLRIGMYRDGVNQPFKGWMDEMRIYNRVLSQAEIQEVQEFALGGITIINQPQNLFSFLGQSVTFSVTARGQGPLSYQWYHGAVPLPNATSPTLLLTGLKRAEAGDYSVVVSNTTRSVTSRTATLTVFDAYADLQMYAGLNINGEVGQTYVVRFTTDVKNTDFGTWTPLATNTLTSPTWFFLDLQSPHSPKRYYGVALQP